MKKLYWLCPDCQSMHYADDEKLASDEGANIRLALDANGYPETIDGLLLYIIQMTGAVHIAVIEE